MRLLFFWDEGRKKSNVIHALSGSYERDLKTGEKGFVQYNNKKGEQHSHY